VAIPGLTREKRMEEHYFICPYCAQHISMLLDVSVREQAYIEDCEVCCRPIEVHYTTHGGQIDSFDAQPA
jgi:transcription elongation factor Elf1